VKREQGIQAEKEKITLWQIIAALVMVGIFYIPFSSFKGPAFLGEYQREPAAIFMGLAFLCLALQASLTKKLNIPFRNLLFQALLVLMGWFVLTFFINIVDISQYYFKETSGIERFIRQFAVLIISGILFLITFYNVFRRYDNVRLFYKVRKVFFYSMIMVTSYGILEILIIRFNMVFFYNILWIYKWFPFTDVYLHFGHDRISSVTYEAPALATYLLTVSGWMFSYIITEKGLKRFIPAIAVIVLALFSDSRAGLVIIGVQVLLFGFLLIKKKEHHSLFLKVIALSTVLVLAVGIFKGQEIADYITEKITSFGVQDDDHSISNRSRFGIQYASYQVFKENPIVGVGYGMQAYEARDKYPNWATVGNWEFKLKYLNETFPSFPPGYNVYTRILAETGIIGMALFLAFLILLFAACLSILKKNDDRYLLALVVLISLVGFCFNWLKMDTIRVFGFWVSFALLLKMTGSSVFKPKKTEKDG
jgi:O-antigen ligase